MFSNTENVSILEIIVPIFTSYFIFQFSNYFCFRKVHVTKQTLELIIDFAREYIIEPNFDAQNDPFIMKNKLETFLLSRPIRVSYLIV